MKRVLLLGLIIANVNAMELVKQSAVSSKDEALKLYTNNTDIYVEDDNAAYRVETCEMNKDLRDLLKYKALAKFLDSNAGYIRIKKEEGDDIYALDAKVRGNGGGPILAGVFYWGTKAVCYGTALAGATTAVVATGGVAGALTGAGVGIVGSGATAGAGVVASTIAGAGLATEAAMTTASVVASSGGIAGAIATVEAGATFMGALGMAIPFL